MIKTNRLCSIFLVTQVCVALSARCQSTQSTNAQSLIAGAHRVVFLGDSITYSGEYVDDVEAVLRVRLLMGLALWAPAGPRWKIAGWSFLVGFRETPPV